MLSALRADGMLVGDLSDDATLRRAVRGHDRLILLLLNVQMAALGVNFVSQLRKLGLDDHLLLTPRRADCVGLAKVWRAVGERESACGWVSALSAHPGWARYGLNGTVDSYALYASRWYMAMAHTVPALSTALGRWHSLAAPCTVCAAGIWRRASRS